MPNSDRTIAAAVRLAAATTRLAVEINKAQQSAPPPSAGQTSRRETLNLIRSTSGGNESSGFR